MGRAGRGAAAAYLYAPKEDPLHRRDWREPYPPAWRKRFGALARGARRRGVDLIPGMAPGLSFDYRSAADYRTLLGKLRAFRRLGCRTLALLMDDIPASLPAAARGRFRSLGEAHGSLLRRLLADLRAADPDTGLWFCPTVYTDQFAAGPIEKDPYLADLAETMPPEIALMWTGPRIIAPRLDRAALAWLSARFGGNLVLWDNLYADDYCPDKIFLGPFLGRTREAWTLARGILLNPTGLPATDWFLLDLLAAHRRGEAPVGAWKAALARHAVPREFLAVAPFLASPVFRPGPKDLSPRRVAALRKALKFLIWDWKGPLHQEWYPYLFMLDADLKATEAGVKDEEWVWKRYRPLVAGMLLRHKG
jgi:hyaluronoglucosaminidase